MTFATQLVATLALVAQAAFSSTPTTDLAAVRQLYASASYEEALSRLSNLSSSSDTRQVEQYRALCLLGLGRTADAEQALQQLVTHDPLYVISDGSVSPRLISMFHDVRRRMLPGTAKDLYEKAKADLDGKHYSAAASELREMLAVLDDSDMPADAPGASDLEMLGQGFLKLADAGAAEQAKADAAAAAEAKAAAEAEAAAAKVPAIYSGSDPGVVPPVDVERRMPAWNPPTAMARNVEYHGILDVVIDEHGRVESATLRQSVAPFYDPQLLSAVRKWRFEPARKDGQPVKYLKVFEIVHSPRS